MQTMINPQQADPSPLTLHQYIACIGDFIFHDNEETFSLFHIPSGFILEGSYFCSKETDLDIEI